MSFHSVNEIDKFSFEDCCLMAYVQEENGFGLELEALIVRPNNSQNTNYTESYAGPTKAHFADGKVLRVVKEGYRYLDANDQPIEEIPDSELSEEEADLFLKSCKEYYLYAFELQKKEGDTFFYDFLIEVPREDVYDTEAPDTYRVEVSFTRADFTWQHYMNRVQR